MSTAGPKAQPAGYRWGTTRYDRFHLIMVTTGVLTLETPQFNTALSPGGVAVMRKGSDFVVSSERGYRGVFFAAIGELPPEFHGPSQTLMCNAEMKALATLMERHLASPGQECQAVLNGLGLSLAWEAVRILERISPTSRDDTARYWAEAVRSTLDATVYAMDSAHEALNRLPLSYRQLSRHFSDTFRQSPKRYQLEAKLREAHRLLVSTSMNVTTIAMELGFSSSQHFATQFKARFGQTPRAFRAKKP